MPCAINEVSRSFSNQDFVFVRINARTVQKQARRGSRGCMNQDFYLSEEHRAVQKRARQGSRSDVRQEFSKPKDYQMSRAINEVSRLFSNCEFDIIPITTETVKN